MEEALNFLNRVNLFSELTNDFKAILAEHLEQRHFARGEIIVREGDVGLSMFMILSGLVSVVHEDNGLGVQFELAQLRPGQVFGEMALLTRETRSATCVALEPTTAFELHSMVFISLLNRVPQVAVGFCQILAQRIAELNRRQGVQILDPSRLRFDPEVYNLVPAQILQQHKIIPLSLEGGRLTVATPEPHNLVGLDTVRRCLPRVDVQPVFISEGDYQRFIDRNVKDNRPQIRRPAGITKLNIQFVSSNLDEGRETLTGTADVTGLVNDIVAEALDRGASDIHIEPGRDGGVVRFRTDGQLKRRDQIIPRASFRPMISRLKVLANMDIAERRLPQDGRIGLNVSGRFYDLRLSSLPTKNGEKLVMRVLDSQSVMKPLEEIVVAGEVNQLIKRLVHQPFGTVIVCGPTGAGKTTTLYSALSERRGGDANLTAVEDPVEYDLPDVVQVQVHEAIGLTYPVVLRTILRQDADVILVGETRDVITAKMVLEAGMAGHLVLTTLHANTAGAGLIRLKEMGMDPYTVSNAVNGVICQRLVRRLCPACTVQTPYAPAVVDLLMQEGILPKDYQGPLYSAPGCSTCRETGFRGRVGVFEVLTMTEPVRTVLTSPELSLDRLTEAARKGGSYVPMANYAAYLLKKGITTPHEILRILQTGD